MNIICHYHTPNRLLLVWQARDNTARSRHVVAEVVDIGGSVSLNYLFESEDFKRARARGFDGHPAFRISQQTHTNSVLEAFMRRLPPRSRGDFGRYLQLHCLSNEQALSDFQLLAYTGAKLINDGFELVCLFEQMPLPFEFTLEVAGYRHHGDIAQAQGLIGKRVTFLPEPENRQDSHAIAIYDDQDRIGYVDRIRASLIQRLVTADASINATVTRVNGQPDRPLVYLFVQVETP